jgi:competence protein ComFC
MLLTRTTPFIYDAFLSLAYPQSCLICGSSVESRIYGSVCLECWNASRLFTGTEPLCWKCGVIASAGLLNVDPETIRCGRCESKFFEVARACGIYEGALRESALILKRQPYLSQYLTNLLLAAAVRPPLNNATRIVPVPLHPERERQRGFNQALLIARTIGMRLKLVVDESSLIRVVASQKYRAGLDAKGRRDTVDQAFAARFPQLISGEKILLVDDVFTTGATVSSCAEVLLSAGAKNVYVLTIARPAW